MTLSTESDTGLPLDMTIFGGMGDLAMRKLLPALYMAYLHGNLPASTRIISTGRQDNVVARSRPPRWLPRVPTGSFARRASSCTAGWG